MVRVVTIVLVHGVPETDAIWSPLIAELGRDDVIRLSPPGFGAPLPADFGATMPDYRDWLIDAIERIGEPVDLIGHDWGGGHVINVAMARPDLLRSWASDAIGLFDPDYVWHDLAQIWQRPGDGEQLVASMMNAPRTDLVEGYLRQGMPLPVAESVASAHGEEMGRAILALYRSAAKPVLTEEARHLPKAASRPGLCVLATEDHFVGSAGIRRRAADRAGARVAVLEGLGHWWMLQDPVQGAAMISDFLQDVG
jgi:pimeloyl-ACP methyl ester carboxylesterase